MLEVVADGRWNAVMKRGDPVGIIHGAEQILYARARCSIDALQHS